MNNDIKYFVMKTNLGKAYSDAEGPDKIALKNVYDAAKKSEEIL